MRSNTPKKYLIFSCLFLTAVLAFVLVAVNVSFHTVCERTITNTLHVVLESGTDPQSLIENSQEDTNRTATQLADTTAKTPYEVLETAIYFTADISEGAIRDVHLTRGLGLTQGEAEAVLTVAMYQNEEQGTAGQFAYLREVQAEKTRYAFLDISEYTMRQISLTMSSIAWGAVGVALMLGYAGFVTARTVAPLSRQVEDGARLLKSSAHLLKKSGHRGTEGYKGLAAGLRAGALIFEGKERRRTVDMSSVATEAVRENRRPIEERNGTLLDSIQPGVSLPGYEAQLKALCTVLLAQAADSISENTKVHIDLLSDSRNVGLVVHWHVAPWESGREPEGDILACVSMLARENGGEASYETLAPSTVCYTIKWKDGITTRRVNG